MFFLVFKYTLVGNQFQLRVQADMLVNHNETLVNHSTGIQESVDIGVNNSTKIVEIESAYAPLNAPVFTTSIGLPPLVVANETNVSSTQIGYLSNLTGDIQTGLNSINSTIQQTNLGIVTSKQVTDEANISTLQSSLSLVSSKQVTDEADIATLQSALSSVASKQVTDEANISTLQSSLSLVSSKQVTDEANISALQLSVLNISNKQVTDEANIATLQTDIVTKAPLVSPTFSGTPTVPNATANTNSLQIANTSYVDSAISSLVGTSPNLLNT